MTLMRRALIYFDQSARDGSIRKAAETLHVASSALNRQLLQLEQELGVELFARLPRGIKPTAAGEALLAFIRQSNRDAIQLKHDLARLKGGLRGTIRIAAAESIIEDVLPAAMAAFQEKYPLIDFTLISGDNYRIREELLAKEADIVCAFDIGEGRKGDAVTMINTEIGIIMPAGHALTEVEQISLADCARYPIIAPATDWLAHSTLRELLVGQNLPLRIVARVERISSLKKLVEAGMGIAFLSRIGLQQQIAANRIVWRPLVRRSTKPATVSLIVEKGRVHPIYLSTFIDILRDHLEKFAD